MQLSPAFRFSSCALLCAVAALPLPSARAQAPAPAQAPPMAQAAAPAPAQRLRSRIYVYRMSDHSSHLVFTADEIWEAPSWSPDGRFLIANSKGAIHRLVFQKDGTAKAEPLAIPADYVCNNDKAISPDGKLLGFSASRAPAKGSNVYVAKSDGTEIRQLTTVSPSYFHGWSPDGGTMAFVAQRNGSKQFDIYSVPTGGGAETQLNADTHHDDGPDYSPDGRWIYINTDRSGHEEVWRFPAAGAGPGDARAEKVLADGQEDWFPHLSPDGRRLVYIAYPAGTPNHNPRTVQVSVKAVTLEGDRVSTSPQTLVTFTGGQGSLNVNSWAPDSTEFAYVSYEAMP